MLVRLQNAVDVAHDAMLEASDADAGFDAGEFSGPAHLRMFERECERLALRFGFASYALALDVARLMRCQTAWPFFFYSGTAPLPN